MRRTSQSRVPTREQIAAGGWTKIKLAGWGVDWPPPKGWRKTLEAQADEVYGSPEKPKALVSRDQEPWMLVRENHKQKGKPPW